MHFEGDCLLTAQPPQVWAALNHTGCLQRATPGLREMQSTGPDQYAVVMEAGVGGIKGRFTGSLAMADKHPPHACRLLIKGRGAPGHVSADVSIDLKPDDGGGTRASYRGEAQVGGVLAAMGGRVLGGVVRMTMAQFFAAIDQESGTLAAP